jgi:hypothetical protein
MLTPEDRSAQRKFIEISGTILFTQSFGSHESFYDAITHFTQFSPTYRPTHWGFFEPMNTKLDLEEVKRRLASTGDNYFGWTRKAPPKGVGGFKKRTYPLKGPQHARHSFSSTGRSDDNVEELLGYLRDAACHYGAEYACCDTLTKSYLPVALKNGFAPHGYLGIFTHELVKWLPDVAWSQIFGPAYIRLFGLDRVMTAPAYKVEELGPEMVYLQLTESLFDLHERYDEVAAVRQEVKKHLDDNIFFDPSFPADHVYRTPIFHFP